MRKRISAKQATEREAGVLAALVFGKQVTSRRDAEANTEQQVEELACALPHEMNQSEFEYLNMVNAKPQAGGGKVGKTTGGGGKLEKGGTTQGMQ